MLKKILIANRGEIACRILRTCKRLGIATVAVYSDADAKAPHVRMADEAVRLGPAPVKESYLSIESVVAAARETGADAIHPGYGLLSENRAFAEAVIEAGVTFIGPPPRVLDAFGDKIKARAVARAVGVEPPPGTDGPIDPTDEAAVAAEAERIGYPVLVKAAGGGGGIGMQIVDDPKKLARAATACSDRGRSAFGDARIYLERYVRSPRHIEVQVFCDAHGNAVALGERECSMQRRHQKILEESPSPASFFAGEAGESKRNALFDAYPPLEEVPTFKALDGKVMQWTAPALPFRRLLAWHYALAVSKKLRSASALAPTPSEPCAAPLPAHVVKSPGWDERSPEAKWPDSAAMDLYDHAASRSDRDDSD